MPHPNIFFLDEEHQEEDDPLAQAARAADIAANDAAQLEGIRWLDEHLDTDGDGYIPNAGLLPFARVQELIRTEKAKQGKLLYQAAPAHPDHFLVEVDDICMVLCYYGLLVGCFLMVLSLLFHR